MIGSRLNQDGPEDGATSRPACRLRFVWLGECRTTNLRESFRCWAPNLPKCKAAVVAIQIQGDLTARKNEAPPCCGAKHQPSYRIVITPALSPRDGSYLDQVGFCNPRTEPATIRIDNDKVVEWLKKGVQPTDRVIRLLKTVRIDPAAVRRGEAIPDQPLERRFERPVSKSLQSPLPRHLPRHPQRPCPLPPQSQPLRHHQRQLLLRLPPR